MSNKVTEVSLKNRNAPICFVPVFVEKGKQYGNIMVGKRILADTVLEGDASVIVKDHNDALAKEVAEVNAIAKKAS